MRPPGTLSIASPSPSAAVAATPVAPVLLATTLSVVTDGFASCAPHPTVAAMHTTASRASSAERTMDREIDLLDEQRVATDTVIRERSKCEWSSWPMTAWPIVRRANTKLGRQQIMHPSRALRQATRATIGAAPPTTSPPHCARVANVQATTVGARTTSYVRLPAVCLARSHPPIAALGAISSSAASCDQIAPCPSVETNDTVAPSARTRPTAIPCVTARRAAIHPAV